MKSVCLCLVAVLLFISCFGCTRNAYPDTIAEYWYCSELNFTLNVTSETSVFVWQENQYVVALSFKASGYDVFIDNGDGAVMQDEILFAGSWTYKQGNLVLKINDDRLFGGIYKELIFEPIEND